MVAISNEKATQSEPKTRQELEEIIHRAIRKVGGSKENDLCKFLPAERGGYIHHFTLRKMKTESPNQLGDMIQRFIMKPDSPTRVHPKPRAPRGTRKRRDLAHLTKGDYDRMLDLARRAGDKELISKLAPRKNLSALRKELIRSIRDNRANQDLWIAYSEAVGSASENAPAGAGASPWRH